MSELKVRLRRSMGIDGVPPHRQTCLLDEVVASAAGMMGMGTESGVEREAAEMV